LAEDLREAAFHYDLLRTADGFGLLSWSAAGSDGSPTCHGADSFVVQEELIAAQTIHYEVKHPRP
jgi:hypothetical protein